MRESLRREAEVAFSKDVQPIWFRLAKYIAFALLVYALRGHRALWPIIATLVILSIGTHLWFRHKTNRWTTPYGTWKPKP